MLICGSMRSTVIFFELSNYFAFFSRLDFAAFLVMAPKNSILPRVDGFSVRAYCRMQTRDDISHRRRELDLIKSVNSRPRKDNSGLQALRTFNKP